MNKNTILDDAMGDTPFGVYDQFYDQKDAKPLLGLLKSNNIPHEIEVPKQLMDDAMGGHAHTPKLFVKVRLGDFQRVNQLLENDALRLIQEGKIDLQEHFLQEYSDEELIDVLSKPEEWNFDTTVIAKHLLQTRGVELSKQQIATLQEKRLDEIRKPRKGNTAWLAALLLLCAFGYLLLFVWFYGYLAGLVIGLGMSYYYWMDTTTDPKGAKFYTFDRQTRHWGRALFVLTILFHLAFLVLFFGKLF